MGIENAFAEFIDDLQDIDMEDKDKRMKRITKKLNKVYYNGNESEEENFILVGSLGRHTAIKGVSDVDIAFVLPNSIYKKYNDRKNNGQSELLQDIKKTLSELASRTIVRGDGQVVVLEFSNYTVELCPYFYKDENTYIYPNSNNGGSWKTTQPILEITESEKMMDETHNNYQAVCNLTRAWKNKVGFKFGGLLIDTLVCNFFNSHSDYKNSEYYDYPQLLKDFFYYLKNLNKDQNYWLALGSNQKVYNKDGQFVSKAKKAYDKIIDVENNSIEMHEKMKELLGSKFPNQIEERVHKSLSEDYNFDDTEEYIEGQYPVDIRYNMEIKCDVDQDGWRKTPLRKLKFLHANKKLEFSIEVPEEVKEPYEVKWKVKNIGSLAREKNMIRGQIIDGNRDKHTHTETTQFKGPHFVEAYIILNNTVVAKDRISVPINISRN